MQIIPDRRTFLAGLSVWFFVLAPAMAVEELSIEKLEVQAKIPVGGDFMAFGFDSLWMMSDARMMRVNPTDNSVTEIKVDGALGSYRGIAVGEGAIWIPDTASKTIYKLDPITNSVVRQLKVDFYDSEGSIGVGEDADAVWIVAVGEKFHAVLTRFNSETGALEANIPLELGSIAALVDFGYVWVTNNQTNELYRIDPETNSVVSATSLHERPRFLASGEGAIWVLNQGDGTAQRVDGKTGTVVATIETVSGYRTGGDIMVGGGYVWVTLKDGMTTFVQIDPKTNTLLRMFRGYGMGDGIRYGASSLWVSGSNIFRIKPPD